MISSHRWIKVRSNIPEKRLSGGLERVTHNKLTIILYRGPSGGSADRRLMFKESLLKAKQLPLSSQMVTSLAVTLKGEKTVFIMFEFAASKFSAVGIIKSKGDAEL